MKVTLEVHEFKFVAQLLSRAPMNLAEHAWTNALLARIESELDPAPPMNIDPAITTTTVPIPQVKP